MKLMVSILLALSITLGLFWLMLGMISKEASREMIDEPIETPVFVMEYPVDNLTTIVRELPKPPEEPEPLPQTSAVSSQSEPLMAQLDISLDDVSPSKFSLPVFNPAPGALGTPNAVGGGDSALQPLAQVAPMYPAAAQQKGLEGFVTLEFSINEQGQVFDVRVLKSKPRKVFDQAARKALMRWKYKPQLEGGKPQVSRAHSVTIAFELPETS